MLLGSGWLGKFFGARVLIGLSNAIRLLKPKICSVCFSVGFGLKGKRGLLCGFWRVLTVVVLRKNFMAVLFESEWNVGMSGVWRKF